MEKILEQIELANHEGEWDIFYNGHYEFKCVQGDKELFYHLDKSVSKLTADEQLAIFKYMGLDPKEQRVTVGDVFIFGQHISPLKDADEEIFKGETDKRKRAEMFYAWLGTQPNKTRTRFNLNWRMGHTLFNVASALFKSDSIQNVDFHWMYHQTPIGYDRDEQITKVKEMREQERLEKEQTTGAFLQKVNEMELYWERQDLTVSQKLHGLKMSILGLFDGCDTFNLNGYKLIDKSNGKEITNGYLHEIANQYPPKID